MSVPRPAILVETVTAPSCLYVSLDDYIVKRWSNSKLAENKKLKDVDPDKLQDSVHAIVGQPCYSPYVH
jgi:hypothetical protein